MNKKSGIFNYYIENNCLIYKKSKKFHIFRCFYLKNIHSFPLINDFLTGISNGKMRSIVYINPLKKISTLWIYSMHFDNLEFNSIIRSLISAFFDEIIETPPNSIVSEFFVHPYFLDKNFIIVDDESNEKFEIQKNPKKSILLYKVIIKNIQFQAQSYQSFNNFLDYLIVAKYFGIIQLKIEKHEFYRVSFIIFFNKLESKIAFDGYLKSLQISSNFIISKLKMEDFKRILQKRIIKENHPLNFDFFHENLFESSYSNHFLEKSEHLSKIEKEINFISSNFVKLSDNVYKNQEDHILIFLTTENFPRLAKILKKYYKSSKLLLVISSNLELYEILKKNTSIEKLPKISLNYVKSSNEIIKKFFPKENLI